MKNIIAFWLTGLCIVVALSENPAEHQSSEVQTGAALQNTFYNDAEDEGYTYERELKKRAITRAYAAAKGLLVMEELLTGAKKYMTTKNARFYRKNGNRQTALADFNSVKPVVSRPNFDLGNRRLGEILIWRVGDRRLVLMPDGDPYYRFDRPGHVQPPVLEIRSATDNVYDIIVYKM